MGVFLLHMHNDISDDANAKAGHNESSIYSNLSDFRKRHVDVNSQAQLAYLDDW